MTDLDTAAAAAVHYATDPRIRQLAEARWRLTTGGTRTDWLALGKDNPEALIKEARDWIRAAVAAGIVPPPEHDTDKDRLYEELKARRPGLYDEETAWQALRVPWWRRAAMWLRRGGSLWTPWT